MASHPNRQDPPGRSGKPHPQYQEELTAFTDLLAAEGCTSYLEIGCRYGDTLYQVAHSLPAGSTVVALDLPGAKSGQQNKGGHQDSFRYLMDAVHILSAEGYDAHAIKGDSKDVDSIKRAKALGPFDCILIDGDHSRLGVESDWNNYHKLSRRLVAFHDIAGTGKWARQIRPFFESLAATRPNRTFISPVAGKVEIAQAPVTTGLRRGIGVVWVGK